MRIKPVLNVLSLVGFIFFSGCASEPQTGKPSNKAWYQTGISAEQTTRDLADCQNEALVNGRSFSPIPAQDAGASIALGMLASSSEKSRQNQIVQTCMAAKGYSLVNTNSPLLTDAQPPQLTPQQSEVDRKLFEDTKAKAESGDANAQNSLGICYGKGRGVVKDFAEALKWYQKAADQNYAAAQYNIGYLYEHGLGAKKDYVEAVKWYSKAAEQGDGSAECNMGYFYSNGLGVKKDSVEEVKWYRKAAEQGEAEAQYNLGINYANGTGVLKDYVEGYKWILLASANGHKLAPNYIPKFERQMTLNQINEGHKLAREFKQINSTVP